MYKRQVNQQTQKIEDVVYSNTNENKTETTGYTSEEVIYKFPYYTSPVVMEDSVNKEQKDSNNKKSEEKNTELRDKVG